MKGFLCVLELAFCATDQPGYSYFDGPNVLSLLERYKLLDPVMACVVKQDEGRPRFMVHKAIGQDDHAEVFVDCRDPCQILDHGVEIRDLGILIVKARDKLLAVLLNPFLDDFLGQGLRYGFRLGFISHVFSYRLRGFGGLVLKFLLLFRQRFALLVR